MSKKSGKSARKRKTKKKSKVVRPNVLSMAAAIRRAVVEGMTTPEMKREVAMQTEVQLGMGNAFAAVKGERAESKTLGGIGKTLVGQIRGRKGKSKRR